MYNYYNEKYECMPAKRLAEVQGERLARTVERVYNNVPHYRAKMDEIGLRPGDIKNVADLSKLPFTYKTDLRDTYPFGLFAAPQEDIVRIHASSGTTGKQTVVGYTAADINVWSEVVARALCAAGLDNKGIMQVSYGYGLFTGGLGAHYGAERVGAAVIPTSSGNTARQIQMIKDLGTTHIACTPSYVLHIAETIEKMGVDVNELKLRAGIFGAEPWTENMRKEIEKRLNIKAYDIYGLSEIIGPGVSYECEEQAGLHVNEDHFLAEIIDPDTGEVLPDGVSGELVFTTITKEGIPLLRYRTRDITSLNRAVCGCGRTFARMNKPRGRTDDMLIIRGVNVFPTQVESVLLGLGDASPHYMLIADRADNMDSLEVQVELNETLRSGEEVDIAGIEKIVKRISSRLLSTLGVAAKVTLVKQGSIPRSEGKAVRVIDNRKLV